jgi:hypothetical protein
MKTIIIFLLSITTLFGQQIAPINLSDNAKLQWNGANVKQKAIICSFYYPLNASADFYIKVRVQFYENISGAYGSKILDLINADQALQSPTLSGDQASALMTAYADRLVEYQTTGKCADTTTGNIVPCLQSDGLTPTVNALAESAYWQTFFLNQVSGVTSISTQKAMNAIEKIEAAIVAKMNTRKNW